jgi:hypothetical protein
MENQFLFKQELMKWIISLMLIVLSAMRSYGAVIVWDGDAGDGLWSTPANWTGDQVPGINDDVVIDNSIAGGSYTVSLPEGNIAFTVNTLIIAPQDDNRIILLIPANNSASPCLTVNGTGDAIILHRGAILKNASGASSGATLVISGTFRINNGGRYIHSTARGNASIVSQLSTTEGTENGEVEFDVPGSVQTLSLTGRTYGTLILSAANHAAPVTYSGNGSSALLIKGDLRLNTGVTFSLGLAANCVIQGNLQQAPSSVFNLQNSTHNNLVRILGNIKSEGVITKTGAGQPVFELNGNSEQSVEVSAALQNIIFRINNPQGIMLGWPLIIGHQLHFANGRVRSSGEAPLVFADGAGYTGASGIAFVDGPVKKKGDDDFEFPTGTGEIFAPIGMAGTGNSSDEFTATYKRQNPQSTPGLGNSVAGSVHHISSSEYWELIQTTGDSPKKIRLTASAYSFAKNLNTLLVARFDGSRWQNEGGTNFLPGPFASPYVTGSIESATGVPANGAFTIGTTDNYALNPLPVKLLSFNAQLKQGHGVMIEWVLAEACDPAVRFELQKEGRNQSFEKIASLPANDIETRYSTQDAVLKPGLNLYRLKITDEHGTISYSRVAAVMQGMHETMLSVVAPSFVTGEARLLVTTDADQQVSLLLYDQLGRLLAKQTVHIRAGKSTIDLPVNHLHRGIYRATLVNRQGYRSTVHFIRQ